MKLRLWVLATLASVFASAAFAQAGRTYTEGPVMQVVSIDITAGHFDEYMAYLASTWTKEQEALKSAGLILDYHIYSTLAGGPDSADVYLATTYKNLAALDGFEERSSAVTNKALGNTPEADMKGMAGRNSYRKVLGIELLRQLEIK